MARICFVFVVWLDPAGWVATCRVQVSLQMTDSSCVVWMSSIDVLVLLLFYIHRLGVNEILLCTKRRNSCEDKKKSLVKYLWMKSITFHSNPHVKNEAL